MNVGILTLPLHSNYGGILQAFALYHTLQSLGHNVTLIDDKIYEVATLREKLSVLKWNVYKLFGLRKGRHPQLELRDKMDVIIPFIQKNIPNQISLENVRAQTFDAIVVGSDQVWRGLYSDQLVYFLDFAKTWNIKRLAYAASFGVDDWKPSDNLAYECKSLLQKFNYVSTREKSGVRICNDVLGCKAEWCIDPTMLLTSRFYNGITSGIEHIYDEKYLLAYLLDNNADKQHKVEEIACKHNLKIINIGISETGQNVMHVEYWLSLIKNSSFVITGSFHGTVFSILFNRPFYVLGNNSRGNSRFDSLLEFTGLSDRTDDFSIDKIDWQVVNKNIDKERRRCINILKENLI